MIPVAKPSLNANIRSRIEGVLSLVSPRSHELLAIDTIGGVAAEQILEDPRAQLVPIVVVVANAEERDRIVRELTAQLDAVLVRANAPDCGGAIEVDGLYIDGEGHRVTVAGEEIPLTHIEFKLLVTLAKRRDRVQTRETLLTDVWGLNPQNKTRTVDTHIKRLRGKLQSAGRFVQCVRGVGYRFSERPSAQGIRVRTDNCAQQVEDANVVAA